MLFRPGPGRGEFEVLRESLARLRRLIVLAQRDAEPQIRVGVLRIQIDGLVKILDRQLEAAAKASNMHDPAHDKTLVPFFGSPGDK